MSLGSLAIMDDGIRVPSSHGAKGFTLIELMIVVAVVAILAAIAYPNFNESVLKSRRGQAKADMAETSQMLERFHTVNNTYVGFTPASLPSPKNGTARYTLNIATTASTFTITAAPETSQSKDKCGTMTLNQAGAKTAAQADCW